LILNKEAIKELIQFDCTAVKISEEINLIDENKTHRNNILNSYDELICLLGERGASLRVAERIWSEFG
jgi:lipid-A-disaccharide synthase